MTPVAAVRPITDHDLARGIRVGLRIVSDGLRVWLSLMMAFALFAFAAWQPDTRRIVTASLFTLLVHVPLLWRHHKESAHAEEA